MNRLYSFVGYWSQPREEEIGAMPVQFWDLRCCEPEGFHDFVCGMIYRAIDFADAMQSIVSLDFAGGSVIVGPGSDFNERLDGYIQLMATVERGNAARQK